ncbi:MAG TPA: hypothetical protein VIO94_01200 [Phenylobacterium sp.]
MTEQTQLPPPPASSTTDERTLPIVAYACYLGGLITGISPIIGVILAHAGREAASPTMRTHYTFQIRTFWIAVLAMLAAGAAMGVGAVLSVILIGIPILAAAGLAMGLICVWFFVRSVVGLIYVAQNQPYPRPETWLV